MANDTDAVNVSLDEYENLLTQYELAKSRIEQAENECANIRTQLIKLLPAQEEAPDGAIGLINGHKRVSFMPSGRRRVNLTKLKARYPSAADECTEFAVVWTLRTHRFDE